MTAYWPLYWLPCLLGAACAKGASDEEESTVHLQDSSDGDTSEDLRDADGDGYWSMDAGGLDCDDSDSAIHPGAEEVPDGIDQDCDGLVDDGTDAFDGDQDGWTVGAGDCDDAEPSTWPGAPDNPCDRVDQDCDGDMETCTRADAAYSRIVSTNGSREFGYAVGGGDFSGDGRPDIAIGVSSDTYVFEAPRAGGEWTDSDAYLRIGDSWMGGAGDGDVVFVNDMLDGVSSALLIGKTQDFEDGIVYLLCDPLYGEIVADDVACAIYLDGDSSSSFGWDLDAGADLTGDEVGDLLIGAPYMANEIGVAYVVSGNARGNVDVSSEAAQIWGDAGRDRAGYSVAISGDNNGDGVGDVLVGATVADSVGGKVGWFMGPVVGVVSLAGADILYSSGVGTVSGHRVAGNADFDGDGRADFALTSWDEGIGGVHIFTDFGGGTLDGAAAHLLGVEHADYVTSAGDYLGHTSALPDANGDGLSDVFAGAPGSIMAGYSVDEQSGLTESAGAVALFLAPFSGTRTMLEADGLWFGESGQDVLGSSVSAVGDINGDGLDDMLAGAANFDNPNDQSTVSRGASYLFLGREAW